ncbi:MAG: hypothetical protein ACE5FW_00110 [Candidatus Aenigmatarchaeota archaeon]
MRGISPIVSAVIVVAIIFGIAAVTTPWMFGLTQNVTNQTEAGQTLRLICQNTAYDFDTGYATYGVDWNFSAGNGTLDVKIVNTGNINLHNFSLEATLNTTTGLEIVYLDINSSSQKTGANPLKPGQTAILKANVTQNLTGTLREIKVLNDVCPVFYVTQEL